MEQEFTRLNLIEDPVSHMCLAGAVVAFRSITQEVASWQVGALLL